MFRKTYSKVWYLQKNISLKGLAFLATETFPKNNTIGDKYSKKKKILKNYKYLERVGVLFYSIPDDKIHLAIHTSLQKTIKHVIADISTKIEVDM
jgi:hypothetical protein